MESTFRNFELLNGSNYFSWLADLKVQLLEFDCLPFLEGSEKEPDKSDSKAWKDYRLRKGKALSLIYYSVDPTLRSLISECEEAKEAFKILKEFSNPKSRATIIGLLDEFFQISYEEEEPIALFINRIKLAVKKLKDAGHELDNLFQAYQVIRALPSDYNSIVQQIYRYSDTDFVISKIESDLILEESRLKQIKSDSRKFNSSIFSAEVKCNKSKPKVKFNKSFKTSTSKSKAIGPCYSCNKYGHLSKDCKLKKPSDKNNKVSCSFVDVQCDSNNSEVNLLETNATFCSNKIDKFSWVVDTAATTHLCNNRDLFTEFNPVNNVKMALAVGEVESPIEGVGKIKMFCRVGKAVNEVTLTNVMYSSRLRRNLLSASRLEEAGAHFVCTKGRLTFFNPKWIKMFISNRVNGLYYFKPIRYDKPVNKINKTDVKTIKVDKIISNCEVNVNESNVENANMDSIWHLRFCHINDRYLSNTFKNESVFGFKNFDILKDDCIPCKTSKSKSVSHKPLNKIRSTKPLELLHMDLCGPIPIESFNGNKYFLTITDDFSRKVIAYPIKNKSDVFNCFLRFQRRAERFLNTKVVCVRSDNGLEFANQKFEKLFEEEGIRHEKTNPYTPQQNGVSERFNLTAMDSIKAMLSSGNISDKFWDEALLCFCYVWNRCTHKNDKTPFELYCNRKPSVAHLKVFGSTAYVGIPKQQRSKLQMRAQVGVMVGYALRTRGYRIFIPKLNKIIETSNVRFNERMLGMEAAGTKNDVVRSNLNVSERVFQNSKFNAKNGKTDTKVEKPKQNFVTYKVPSYNPYSSTDSESESESEMESKTDESEDESSVKGKTLSPKPELKNEIRDSKLKPLTNVSWVRHLEIPQKRKSNISVYYSIEGKDFRLYSYEDVAKYCKQNNIRYNKSDFNFDTKDLFSGRTLDEKPCSKVEVNHTEVFIPKSYNEAIKSPQSNEWKAAMQEEINMMHDREVWELADPPENANVLGSRWVFTLKRNAKNEIVRYKARLVAQGFKQQKGETYDDVFSPVVNFSVIRLLFIIFVSLLNWQYIQLDITSAYLYAPLENDVIYMYQPQGFVNNEFGSKVCFLKKALYGLHQSARAWNTEFEQTLTNLNFNKIDSCNGVYVYKNCKAVLIYYVDDILLFSKSRNCINEILSLIKNKFDIKILGKTQKLLGIEFLENNKQLFIHQQTYINKLYNDYQSYDIKLSTLPISKNLKLSKRDCPDTDIESKKMKSFPYRNLLGSLAFIANRTRPDITFAVNFLSQYQENPGFKHWQALLRLLGYLKYTSHYMLNLSNVCSLNLIAYADADYASNIDDRKSCSGYLLLLDQAPISWSSRRQKCVALSTLESEYVAVGEAAKEFVWIQRIVKNELLNLKLNCNIMYCDNLSTIEFTRSNIENHRTKHIEVRHHYIRELVENKMFNVTHINSKNNLADIFTKPQTKESLLRFCSKMFKM